MAYERVELWSLQAPGRRDWHGAGQVAAALSSGGPVLGHRPRSGVLEWRRSGWSSRSAGGRVAARLAAHADGVDAPLPASLLDP